MATQTRNDTNGADSAARDIGSWSRRLARLAPDTLACLGFFSRLPSGFNDRQTELRVASASWPLAGLLIAIGPAVVLVLCDLAGLPAIASATLATAAMMILTGAMHEDGLADTLDGLGGGIGVEDKLALMRDSRLGTYGALGLLVSAIVRVTCLASIVATGLATAVAVFFATAVVSRALALFHWYELLPARRDGLAVQVGRPDWRAAAIGLATGAIALVALVPFAGSAAVFGGALAALAIVAFNRLVRAQIGGHTGDTTGAAQQIAETALLAGLAAI